MKAALLLLVSCAICAQELLPGKTAHGKISGHDSRTFTIQVKSGEFVRILVWQPWFPATLRLLAADRRSLVELNLPGSEQKMDPLVWIADGTGQYLLELTADGQPGDRDQFRVRLERPRAPAPTDRKTIEAQNIYARAREFEWKRDYTHAIEEWERALALYRDAGDREREATALSAIGAAYMNLGRRDRALGYYEQALPMFRALHDRRAEGEALNGLGTSYTTVDNDKAAGYYQQALRIFEHLKDLRGQAESLNGLGNSSGTGRPELVASYWQRALALRRAAHDSMGEARSLNNVANSYNASGQHEKAIEQYDQVRRLALEMKNRRLEAVALINTGIAFNSISKWDQAIERYEAALAIFREINNRALEGHTLYGLGLAYFNLSQFQKAIDYDEQALAIAREVKSPADEGMILNNLGEDYAYLGRRDEAIRYLEQALPISRERKDPYLEGFVLSNLGFQYWDLKQFERSRSYYEQALALGREIKDRGREGAALGGLAENACSQNDCRKAVEYEQQALVIARELGDRRSEGMRLNELATDYLAIAELENAADAYRKGLAIFREIKDPGFESRSLEGLMDVEKAMNQPRLAIFFGKQCVNAVQSIRVNIAGLDKESQRSFIHSNEHRYHSLAELLISEGRLTEAEEVLALLKEEEYFEFVRRDASDASSLDKRADLTPEEAEWDTRYREVGGRLMAIGAERGVLLAKKTRSAQESRRLLVLEQDLAAGNKAFERFLGELARNFNARPERIEQIRETQGIMEDLRELPAGTVAIYTLVGQETFHAILRSADAVKAYEFPITAADLNRKILKFREAVQNPAVDPRPLGEELYRILVAGMADDLRQAGARTLMWSLDGVLRYLPIAALYDGREYLIEQYRLSVMTLASNSRLKDRPDREWTAAEFGVTKAFDENPALPAVAEELNGIAAILHGKVKLNDQFTEEAMRETLLERRPVVHIASHFRFQPGDQSQSFLLLGDGRHFSLAELKSLPNLFGGVQLLTLSACNTGLGDGAEVEGFGTLAQRQGAKAVIASLWSVADTSTSQLMRELYRLRQASPDLTKLEALRESQLALLRGASTADQTSTDRGVAKPELSTAPAGAPFLANPQAPFAHPFYWAPFFLMGNWL